VLLQRPCQVPVAGQCLPGGSPVGVRQGGSGKFDRQSMNMASTKG